MFPKVSTMSYRYLAIATSRAQPTSLALFFFPVDFNEKGCARILFKWILFFLCFEWVKLNERARARRRMTEWAGCKHEQSDFHGPKPGWQFLLCPCKCVRARGRMCVHLCVCERVKNSRQRVFGKVLIVSPLFCSFSPADARSHSEGYWPARGYQGGRRLLEEVSIDQRVNNPAT